jgi:hypothetical protein
MDSIFIQKCSCPDDGIRAITREEQLKGVILPAPIRHALSAIQAEALVHTFPGFEPEDTLYYDEIRDRWHILPDLSVFWNVWFPDTLSMADACNELLQIDGITSADSIEIPFPD